MNRPNKSRTLVGHSDTWVTSVAISPDGTWLASGGLDKTIGIWDTVKGRRRKRLTGHARGVEALAISPDGTWLASTDGITVYLWDPVKGRLRTSINTVRGYWPGSALAASPDGTWLATAISHGEVEQWDIASGRPRSPHLGGPYMTSAVAISPDGHWLATASAGTVHIWGTATGENHHTILTDHDREVHFVAFSPDGTRLVSSGLDSSPVKLWDTITGQLRCSILTGHDEGITSVAISPDSAWLATAGRQLVKGMFDDTVELWDAETGEHLATLRSGSRVLSVAISPDGTWLAAGEWRDCVRIWDLVYAGILSPEQ